MTTRNEMEDRAVARQQANALERIADALEREGRCTLAQFEEALHFFGLTLDRPLADLFVALEDDEENV